MEYWTVLWITVLSGPLDGSTSGLIYRDLSACEAAISPVVATIDGQYDYNVICEETLLPSSLLRPQPRPEGLGNG
jgi:hypothetical protein